MRQGYKQRDSVDDLVNRVVRQMRQGLPVSAEAVGILMECGIDVARLEETYGDLPLKRRSEAC